MTEVTSIQRFPGSRAKFEGRMLHVSAIRYVELRRTTIQQPGLREFVSSDAE